MILAEPSSWRRPLEIDEIPVSPGHTRVYRAVSEAEYLDIQATGCFREGINTLGGKWFADSLEGARLHGDDLFPDGDYRVLEADVPDDARSLYRRANLDDFGPARYLDILDLKDVIPRLRES